MNSDSARGTQKTTAGSVFQPPKPCACDELQCTRGCRVHQCLSEGPCHHRRTHSLKRASLSGGGIHASESLSRKSSSSLSRRLSLWPASKEGTFSLAMQELTLTSRQ